MSPQEKGAFKKGLLHELEDKYILTCKRFPIHPADFLNQESAEHGEEHYLALIKIYKKLEEHYQTHLKIQNHNRIEEDPEETLQKYCDSHSVSLSPIECARRINNAHHGRILRSVYRVLIGDRSCSKVHVCWMYDEPSSGKSQFIRRIRKIFSGDEVEWRGQYLPVTMTNRPDMKT